MLRRAKQFKGVVFATKARPGLTTVQTRQAATSGIILDDLGLVLKKKKSHSNSTCTTDKHIRD
uniref:Uncharacterized protein n=1 Tax=Pan troglodytes TaxID=9598 RepID=G2HGT3_PANTR|nr:hypothetical protein [Pan troglodytes]